MSELGARLDELCDADPTMSHAARILAMEFGIPVYAAQDMIDDYLHPASHVMPIHEQNNG
jgi:hypothetical protein